MNTVGTCMTACATGGQNRSNHIIGLFSIKIGINEPKEQGNNKNLPLSLIVI